MKLSEKLKGLWDHLEEIGYPAPNDEKFRKGYLEAMEEARKMEALIDELRPIRKEFVHNESYYEFGKDKTRTRERLKLIWDLGFTEVGIAHFGIKGSVSGLYIEKIWNETDQEFYSRIEWMKSCTKQLEENKKEN